MRSEAGRLCLLMSLAASPWPPPLSSHVMTFEPSLSRVVLFGGSNPAREMSSTLWSWDGSSWIAHAAGENGPAPRIHAGMAHDPVRNRLVVFGGIGADAASLEDLWEWDGAGWSRVGPHAEE